MRGLTLLSFLGAPILLYGADPLPIPKFQVPHTGSGELSIPLIWDKDDEGKTPDDLDASAQLSWSTDGLLLRFLITDNDIKPAPKGKAVGEGDHVELTVTLAPGQATTLRSLVSLPDEAKEIRQETQDLRNVATKSLLVTAKAVKQDEKHREVEILIPWSQLGDIPLEGRELGISLAVIDIGKDAPRFTARWQGNEDPYALQTIRLVQKSDETPALASRLDLGTLSSLTLRLAGSKELAGRTVDIVDSTGRSAGTVKLVEKNGRAYGMTRLPVPSRGQPSPGLWLQVDGKTVGLIPENRGIDLKREKLFAKSQIVAPSAVFGKPAFPAISYLEPAQAENCLGPYKIKTRFFDAQYQEVTSAEKPGRYGAVVQIEDAEGRTRTRFLTLCRTGNGIRWHDWKIDFDPKFAAEFGWDVLPEQEPGLEYFLKQRLNMAGSSGSAEAALTAALLEKQTEDYQDADTRWWIGLKRKLGFYPPAGDAVPLSPRAAKQAKPELRPGTEAEAGFKPGARERLDAICKKWAEESGEPFSVCIARKGVVLLNEGYGVQDGKPMQTDAPGWMASISKLSGTLTLMRLVEEGKVDLDAPASRYLPLLGDSPITVRQILTHVSGIGHIEHNWARAWSEPIQDIDAMVGAALYSAPPPGTFLYSNAEYDLAGRIVESVTGEPCGEATRQVLFEPLGATGSYLFDYAGRRSYGTALDYAKVAQMILNGGTYGSKEILRPDTIESMLPRGVPSGGNRPIGLGYDEGGIAGFPGYAPGHGAASGATFRFMPEKELVLVVTRNTFGKDHGKHQLALVEALTKELE
jgi:CubicO group peptidase (beta-lactamase class C family)